MRDDDRDGVCPSWDGSLESWDTNNIKVNIFLKTQPAWKLPQSIAKLVSKLTDKAWELIEQTEEESLESLRDKAQSIGFLKKNLLASAVPALGRHFRRWFSL